ncbi:MAG TPA: DUF192 domain-containing protein [Polyangia bacterium]|nr:DUF192 domain-containing protein [Polyangia bacterium]
MRGFRLCVLSFVAFIALAPLPACKTARTPTPTVSTVTIDTGARRVPFKVELAVTPSEHERGLMFRDHLNPDAGMLFISDSPRRQVFWMKNTLIPLDMIFIGADWRIAGIVENAEPKTLTSREVPAPSQYVLEIGGGLSALYGIHAGQVVDFQAGSGAK